MSSFSSAVAPLQLFSLVVLIMFEQGRLEAVQRLEEETSVVSFEDSACRHQMHFLFFPFLCISVQRANKC